MRLLVCGGRSFSDRAALAGWMNEVIGRLDREAITIVHGGAPGADSLAGAIARAAGVREWVFPADWAKHGKAAGPIRNQQMLDEADPDIVLAAPGGRGTADMVRRAAAAKIPVIDRRDLRTNGAQNTGKTGIQRHTLADTAADEAAKDQ